MKKDKPFQFKLVENEMKVVDVVKEKHLKPPVLALSKSNVHFTIDTDTCDTQRGASFYKSQETKF